MAWRFGIFCFYILLGVAYGRRRLFWGENICPMEFTLRRHVYTVYCVAFYHRLDHANEKL